MDVEGIILGIRICWKGGNLLGRLLLEVKPKLKGRLLGSLKLYLERCVGNWVEQQRRMGHH